MMDGSPDSGWVVRDELDLPDQIVRAATDAQATLSDKLAALRDLAEPFPNGTDPAAADRWIEDGAAPHRLGSGSEASTEP